MYDTVTSFGGVHNFSREVIREVIAVCLLAAGEVAEKGNTWEIVSVN